MLSGRTRHELSCAACGAPLHELKALRSDNSGERHLLSPGRVARTPKDGARRSSPPKPVKKKKAKRKKGLMARVLDEAFDLVEDIFD